MIKLISAAAVASIVALSACGGDDGGGATGGGDGGGRMTDEQFCARLAQIEEETAELSDEEADAQFFDVISSLVSSAPNDEIRDALAKFSEVAEALEGLDESDPEEMEEVFGLMFDPEVMAAGETLDTYFTETCGFTDDFDDVEDGTED